MRLYSRTGAAAITNPVTGVVHEPGPDGGFDLPDDFARAQLSFHVNGGPLWETQAGRSSRLVAEELERRKDPATLLDAVNQLVAAAKAVTAEPEAAKPSRARKTAPAEA